MERILIEVAPKVAKAWRKLTPARKKELAKKASDKIEKEVLDDPRQKYLKYLDTLRTKMAQRGLTQEILDEILSEKK